MKSFNHYLCQSREQACLFPTQAGEMLSAVFILFLIATLPANAAENPTFDSENFFGQRIAFQGVKSASVRTIRLVLQFPRGYRMLFHAKPSLKIFTKEGVFLKEFLIKKNSDSFLFNQEISSEQLYAQIGLYYCKEGDEGMCLLKNLLFEISLERNLPVDDIFLNYTVTE